MGKERRDRYGYYRLSATASHTEVGGAFVNLIVGRYSTRRVADVITGIAGMLAGVGGMFWFMVKLGEGWGSPG
jgi:hypothetical protein